MAPCHCPLQSLQSSCSSLGRLRRTERGYHTIARLETRRTQHNTTPCAITLTRPQTSSDRRGVESEESLRRGLVRRPPPTLTHTSGLNPSVRRWQGSDTNLLTPLLTLLCVALCCCVSSTPHHSPPDVPLPCARRPYVELGQDYSGHWAVLDRLGSVDFDRLHRELGHGQAAF